MRGASRFNAWEYIAKKSRVHLRAAALKFSMARVLLEGLGHVPGADAAGTGLDSHNAAVFHRSDLLQVRIPHGAGFVVGMAYIVSEAGPFSTDITFS
jgi:hypothetical protein